MHIGIASPISTQQLANFLNLKGGEPSGTEGTTAPNLLIIELLNRGYTVSVFSLSREVSNEFVIYGNNITIYYLPFRHRARKYALDFYLKERRFLKLKIKQVNPDIIHAHWQYEYAWASLDSGIKTIVTCRDSPLNVFLLHKKLFWFLRMLIAFIVLRKATNITATSSYLIQELKKMGVKRSIVLIPNFEPDWLFNLDIIKDKNLNIPKIIMINNGFDNRKNVHMAIYGFQKFRESFPNAELFLYGHDYEENGKAQTWAIGNKLNDNIYYKGYKSFDCLMYELRTCTMLVHPSKEETFGNILTESMALGVPVIGGINSGAVPWVIGIKQEGGVLCDIEDPDAIAASMHKIIENNNIYSSFVLNARKHAKDNFSAKEVVDAYIAIYSK